MTLLLIAAEPREFRGILRQASAVRPAVWPVNWCREATLGGHRVFLAASGVGAARAARAVETAPEADAVISVGFCGALDPTLGPGDILVATAVRSAEATFPARLVYGACPNASGAVWSAGQVVRTAAEKTALRASGAAVVEMEAAGVAQAALARSLPFACVKAVTDLAGEDLATDFQAALQPDGYFDTMVVLRASLRRPVICVPELFRLHRRAGLAARQLGEFFADCRF
jgi:nucleoside phosphorylase